MPRLRSLSILLVLISYSTFAQTDIKWQNCYVVSSLGDTLKGQCQFKNLPMITEVMFTNSTGGSSQFHPGDIRECGSYEGGILVSGRGQEAFLSVLVNGTIKLAESSGQFFAVTNGEAYALLNTTKSIERSGQSYSLEAKEYVGVLRSLFNGCGDIQRKVDNTELTQNSLARLFETYNKCTGQRIVKVKPVRDRTTIFGIGPSFYQTFARIGNMDTNDALALNLPNSYANHLSAVANVNDINHYSTQSYGMALMVANVAARMSFFVDFLHYEINMHSTGTVQSSGFLYRANNLHFGAQHLFGKLNNPVSPFVSGGFGFVIFKGDQPSGTYVNPIGHVSDPRASVFLGLGCRVNSAKEIKADFTVRYEFSPGPYVFPHQNDGATPESYQSLIQVGMSLFILTGSHAEVK